MLKLCENGSNIDYLYETSSVLRKVTETEIFGFYLLASVRVFKNRTEIRFPHIPTAFDDHGILEGEAFLSKELWTLDSRWNKNVVSLLSSVMMVIRLPNFCVSYMAISCLWYMACDAGQLGTVVFQ